MNQDDELRYLFARAFEGGVPSDECPSPDALLDAFHQVLPEPARLAVVDHLATCAVCAEAWRLARNTPSPAPPRRGST
jgi:hypothetical protein